MLHITPSELFFSNKYGLFRNQTDLSRQLIQQKDGYYYRKKLDTLKSLLSKVLRGERNLNTNLTKDIILLLSTISDKKRIFF